MITDRLIDQAFSDLRSNCGGVRDDYFGLLYLEQEHKIPRDRAVNQIAFGGHDYGFDGFHYDEEKRNLYLYQFKNTTSHAQFKGSMQRLIDDGLERAFLSPNKDDQKNQVLLQLRSCLIENAEVVGQVYLRFVFAGDPEEAERSILLNKLREDLEDKKYIIDKCFAGRRVGFVVEFRSSSGRVGVVRKPTHTTAFDVDFKGLTAIDGPCSETMHIGFIPLHDLAAMHREFGPRFFDSNIRYGLGESEAVNRAISGALKQIVIDKSDDPRNFSFNHNGITLYADKLENDGGQLRLYAPRLLNGAQTVTTLSAFLEKNKDNPKLAAGKSELKAIQVICKIITAADQKTVTRITINNNRQNPVEPWNLHANDVIQLDLQDKFRSDLGIYYERQENAFDQLSIEDLEEYGIADGSRAIQMLKLTQTFLLTDGQISRLSQIRRVFEDDKTYEQVFRAGRLKADSRHILLCYKIQFNLRRFSIEIEQKGQNKYWFVSRARHLLWALLCQGILNMKELEEFSEMHGKAMAVSYDYKEKLSLLATARVRPLLAELMEDPEYAEKVAAENLSFLRTDRAFDKCMEQAYRKWRWVYKKLG